MLCLLKLQEKKLHIFWWGWDFWSSPFTLIRCYRTGNRPQDQRCKGSCPFQKGPIRNPLELIRNKIHASAVCQRRAYPSGNPPDKAKTHERGSPFAKKEKLMDSHLPKWEIRLRRSKRKSEGGNKRKHQNAHLFYPHPVLELSQIFKNVALFQKG